MGLFHPKGIYIYKLKYHKSLASRWDQFPRSQQILAIASELQRARNFLVKKDYEETKNAYENAYERAFELLDLTISLDHTYFERYELLRFREMLGHAYLNESNNTELVGKLFDVLISLNKDSFNALH
ncbi:MAG: hypothetical protein WBE28_07215 [bacterium]